MKTTNGTQNLTEGLYAAGHYFLQQERPKDALVVFRTMLVAAPEDERSWLGLATCHEQIDQFELAEELLIAGFQASNSKVRCLATAARLVWNRDEHRADALLDRAADMASTEDETTFVTATRNYLTSRSSQ